MAENGCEPPRARSQSRLGERHLREPETNHISTESGTIKTSIEVPEARVPFAESNVSLHVLMVEEAELQRSFATAEAELIVLRNELDELEKSRRDLVASAINQNRRLQAVIARMRCDEEIGKANHVHEDKRTYAHEKPLDILSVGRETEALPRLIKENKQDLRGCLLEKEQHVRVSLTSECDNLTNLGRQYRHRLDEHQKNEGLSWKAKRENAGMLLRSSPQSTPLPIVRKHPSLLVPQLYWLKDNGDLNDRRGGKLEPSRYVVQEKTESGAPSNCEQRKLPSADERPLQPFSSPCSIPDLSDMDLGRTDQDSPCRRGDPPDQLAVRWSSPRLSNSCCNDVSNRASSIDDLEFRQKRTLFETLYCAQRKKAVVRASE